MHKSSWNEFWTFLRDLHMIDLSVSALCSLKGASVKAAKSEWEKSLKLVPRTFVHCYQEHKLAYPKKAYTDLIGIFWTPEPCLLTWVVSALKSWEREQGNPESTLGGTVSRRRKSINVSVWPFYSIKSSYRDIYRFRSWGNTYCLGWSEFPWFPLSGFKTWNDQSQKSWFRGPKNPN